MLIGLMGYKGCGKDTAADILSDGFMFKKYAFAAPVKKVLAEMFDWPMKRFEYPLKEEVDEEWGISPRQAMILLGTDFAQYMLCEELPLFKEKTGRSFWVKKFEHWYENTNSVNVVVSDIRFQHEVDSIKKYGGSIVRVENPRVSCSLNHESETNIEFIKYDYFLNNNGTIRELSDNLYDLYLRIQEAKT